MGDNNTITVYHGTDLNCAETIMRNGFIFKKNPEHWLGNGIYFFKDYSLAKWWCTNPSSKFGTKIIDPVVMTCDLKIEKNKILDLRNLKGYNKFCEIFDNNIIHVLGKFLYNPKDTFTKKEIRTFFCDYIRDSEKFQLIIGNFISLNKSYLSTIVYPAFFDILELKYIETQICVFDPSIITNISYETIKQEVVFINE
jgi:hypothetical protein